MSIRKDEIINKRKRKIIIILVVAVALIGTAFARYMYNYKENSLYEAENFYFTSDLLTEDGKAYRYQKGVNSIKVNIYNSVDELRYTEYDIKYIATITDISSEINISKSDDIINEIQGTISGDSRNSKEITFDNLKDGTYRVKVTTLSPYVKTLEATFVITNADNSIKYDVSDSSDSTVLFLTITTVDYSGNIKITIPDGIYPDNTDNSFSNINIDNSKTINILFKQNSSYTYKFFKSNPQSVYSKDNFIVEEGN